MSVGMKTVACAAPYGEGGLGRHLAEVIERARAESQLATYYCLKVKRLDGPVGQEVHDRIAPVVARIPPMRFDQGWKTFAGCERFDKLVARRLVAAHTHIGFSGQSLRTFLRARTLGVGRLELVSPTAHVNHVARQHATAYETHGIERGWLSERLRHKCLREYEVADAIVVTSSYAYDSFVSQGVPTTKLEMSELGPHPRFATRNGTRMRSGSLRVVYVGGLSVAKGLPVLLEAFGRLRDLDAELTLVGGWGSRPMRRYLEDACGQDSRVRIAAGDPLPHLLLANVLVHPSYQDGLGLAPLEALACGLPVIVTEDTGMKDRIRNPTNGFVIPTGDVEALLGRLEYFSSTLALAAS